MAISVRPGSGPPDGGGLGGGGLGGGGLGGGGLGGGGLGGGGLGGGGLGGGGLGGGLDLSSFSVGRSSGDDNQKIKVIRFQDPVDTSFIQARLQMDEGRLNVNSAENLQDF